MKKTVLFRGALLFAAVAFCAVAANAQILWKISGNGAKDSYILGSHHVAPMSVLDGIAGFNDAFASCQQMYGEIDMESATQDMVMQSQKYMMAPADSTLSKVLTADQLAIVDAAMQKYVRMSVAQLDKVSPVKPAVISAQIAVLQAAKTFEDFDPNNVIDAAIQQKAKDANMPVKGFETAEYQMQLLFGTPISVQVADLMKLLTDETAYMEYTRMLTDVYSQQDLDTMFELMNNPEFGMSEYECNVMINKRNEAWIEQLKTILPEASTFIVVGAGHLPGDKGMLSLLRKAGYTVTPVN